MCVTQGHLPADKRRRGGFKFSEVRYVVLNCGYKAFIHRRLIGRKMRDLLINNFITNPKVKELQLIAMKEKDDNVVVNKQSHYANDFEEKQLPNNCFIE